MLTSTSKNQRTRIVRRLAIINVFIISNNGRSAADNRRRKREERKKAKPSKKDEEERKIEENENSNYYKKCGRTKKEYIHPVRTIKIIIDYKTKYLLQKKLQEWFGTGRLESRQLTKDELRNKT